MTIFMTRGKTIGENKMKKNSFESWVLYAKNEQVSGSIPLVGSNKIKGLQIMKMFTCVLKV